MKKLEVFHCGTLRFWGEWFGRSMDNVHRVVNAIYDEKEDLLLLYFDLGEICEVFSPIQVVSTEKMFYIENAKSVTWSWYPYGEDHVKKNLRFLKYIRKENGYIFSQETSFSETLSEKFFNPQNFYAVEIV